MPFYEYRCHECGHEFEQYVRSFMSKVTPECPECGSEDVSKVVSMFGSTGSSGASLGAANCAPSGG